MRVPLLLLMLVLPPAAWAQTGVLQGTARDDTGQPLPGVHVLLDTLGRGTATDLQGHYRLAGLPPGTYVVTASAVGFRRMQQTATVRSDTTMLDFVLGEVVLQSGEVVVTASRRAQLSGSVPVSMSLLTPRDLDARNITSLDDALRYVPGVQMAGNQVNVRGSSGFSYNTGSRVLLLVDGLPMLRPDADGVAFDAVPATQIERIEVVKGPGSALYGGGALGGVVNVITRDFPEAPETTLRLFGGAYTPVRYALWRAQWEGADAPRPLGGGSVSHARRVGERFGFWVNAAYRADTGYMNYTQNRTLQLFTKAGWKPGAALRLDLLTGLTRRRSDTFLYWNGARDALNPGVLDFGGTPATGADDNLTNELSLLPSLTHLLGPHLFHSLKGRLYGVLIQPLDDDLHPKPLADGTVGFRYGGEWQLDWSPAPGRYLTAGVTADANASRSSFFNDDVVRSQPEAAVFGQWEQQLAGRLNVVAGLRFDSYRIRAGHVERKLSPRLNLSYPLHHHLTARAAYGQGFRVPSVAERYVNDRSFFPIAANLDLRPETSSSYEVGLHGLLPLRPAGIQVDVALFWNDYRRLIEPTFVPAARGFQFINLTRARIRGLEATLEAATGDARHRLQAGYTLLDARDLSAGLPLVFRARHLLKLALSSRLYGPFEAGLDYRLASRPARVDSDFARFVRDADTLVPTRVLDVRLGARWRAFRATLLVNNALDYYYLERPALLAPTRHVVLQLQATF